MKQFTVYETSTGKIIRTGYCPDIDFNKQAHVGETVIEGIFFSSEYYVDISVSPNRPVLKTEFANVTDRNTQPNTEIVFSGLPNPTTVIINSNTYEVTDGSFEIKFENEGSYYLYFTSLTKKNKGAKVEVSL